MIPSSTAPWPCSMEETRGVLCHSFAAFALWYLGYPDQARHHSQAALTLARELSHLVNLAAALYFAASLRQYCREWQPTHELAEAAITLATEQEFPHWVVYGTILRGWALAAQGQREEGIAQMRQGLAAQRTLRGRDTTAECIWPCWPRRMGTPDRLRRDCGYSPRRWP